MVSIRPLESGDLATLETSLHQDEYHRETSVDFFCASGTACNVYEDEQGPVMFVRGTKALRIDIQFVNNDDHERNAAAMLADFERFADQARANGFTEIIFSSSSRALRAFCKRRFKFHEVDGELRRFL